MNTSAKRFNWPHAIACLLVAATAVLLSFGALVTTYEAAMAVPDWPATYGHNMLLYPWAEWLKGPWDLFLEHGHRLLGMLVGVIALGLLASVWRVPTTAAVRWLTVAAVVLVIVQGGLGGARVLLDDKTVAKVHACTGPLFFAVAVAVAAVSRRRPEVVAGGAASRVPAALVIASYLQLVAGAQLRHLDAAVEPSTFHSLVGLHILGAVAVTVLAAVGFATLGPETPLPARRWARVLLGAVGVQLALGAGAWIANWGLPADLLPDSWQWSEPLRARSGWTAAVVTAHVVLGMLILGGAVVLAIESGALGRRLSTAGDLPAAGRAFA